MATDGPVTTDRLRELLLWARTNGFHLSEVTVGDVRVVASDLRVGAEDKGPPPPRTAHEAWGQRLGIDIPEDDIEDDDPPPTRMS